LIAGDYLSPEEIPFVDDLAAYRATLARLIELAASLDEIIPGHGPILDRSTALAIARADLEYLDRLAAARTDEERLAVPLPRAASVPGMMDHHRENAAKAR
jgi:glyoxylase-like metal-dependent hydrolase (beta-lactamase superfamily II)